ncbi:MAG: hypothetical protein K6F83_07885 [Clostridiales bacterium]|nr:hypothetical protein [Clostridiales bacterium]
MKFRGVTLLGIILMVFALLIQLGLYGYSYTGYEDDSPVLVMYGLSGGHFTNTTFRMAMGRAGFQTLVLNKDLVKAQSIGEEISLPRGYRSQSIVILAQGEGATSSLKLFDADEDTLGFVLVEPEFETNFSMEGMSSDFPTHNVAIFTGDRSGKSDAKIMYERLSGEDTLYGITSKTGGLMSSEIFMNPKGNRYLSIAAVDPVEGSLFYGSPAFQIELANYLATNYQEDYSSPVKAIIGWYILFILSIAFFIAGLFMFLVKIPIVRYRMEGENKDKTDSVTKIILLSVAVLVTLLLVVLEVLGNKEAVISMVLGFFPLLMLLIMTGVRLPYLVKNFKVKRPHKSKFVALILMALILSFVVMLANNTIGIINSVNNMYMVLIFILAMLFDFASIMIVSRCDSVSRIKGFGGCSYFGTYTMFLLTLLPSVMLFFASALLGKNGIAVRSFGGFLCAAMPFISSLPIKRHANAIKVTSTVHAIIYFILLLLTI